MSRWRPLLLIVGFASTALFFRNSDAPTCAINVPRDNSVSDPLIRLAAINRPAIQRISMSGSDGDKNTLSLEEELRILRIEVQSLRSELSQFKNRPRRKIKLPPPSSDPHVSPLPRGMVEPTQAFYAAPAAPMQLQPYVHEKLVPVVDPGSGQVTYRPVQETMSMISRSPEGPVTVSPFVVQTAGSQLMRPVASTPAVTVWRRPLLARILDPFGLFERPPVPIVTYVMPVYSTATTNAIASSYPCAAPQ